MMRRACAFTLVEVLVVIAIASALMGMLFPAVGAVREASRQVVCGVHQRTLYTAVMVWAGAHRDNLPGVNTTGRPYYGAGAYAALHSIFGDTTPTTPTTMYDWISPAIGESAHLSPNRARRTKQIFEDLGCPSAKKMNDTLFGSGVDMRTDFKELLDTEGIGQVSYLAPGPFHLLGTFGGQGIRPEGPHFGWRGPALTPRDYKPRLERIGAQLSSKIFVADGTRYLNARGLLDFDVTPNPEFYGSFTSSTPIYEGSTAYGRSPNRPEFVGERHPNRSTYPHNRALSYRHHGNLNVLYYDGHLKVMSETESKSDAAPWYPTGSVFTGVNATRESLQRHKEGERLP